MTLRLKDPADDAIIDRQANEIAALRRALDFTGRLNLSLLEQLREARGRRRRAENAVMFLAAMLPALLFLALRGGR